MSNFYLGNICIHIIPLFLEKNSRLPVFTIGNVEPTKLLSSLKCLSNLVTDFSLILHELSGQKEDLEQLIFWQSYAADYNPLLLYSRIMCIHNL